MHVVQLLNIYKCPFFSLQYTGLTVQITISSHEIKTHSFLLFLIHLFVTAIRKLTCTDKRTLLKQANTAKTKRKRTFCFRFGKFGGKRTTTGAGTPLCICLLELVERREHASEYLQQTNVHRRPANSLDLKVSL